MVVLIFFLVNQISKEGSSIEKWDNNSIEFKIATYVRKYYVHTYVHTYVRTYVT